MDRFWNLLAKKLSGEATRQELQELENLLKENTDLAYSEELLARLWKNQQPEREEDSLKAYENLLIRLKRHGFDLSAQIAPSKQKAYQQKKLLRLTSFSMLQSYLTIAWRNLVRGKAFSIVNVGGLAMAMASAILILLWIHNELTLDTFHKNKDRIYQVYSRGVFDGKPRVWGGTSMLLAPIVELNYPEVETAVRINPVSAFIFHAGDKHIGAYGLLTDPGFLKVFDFPFLQGDRTTALNSPRSLVVTDRVAKKLFGQENAIGKVVRIDSSGNFIITGVLKDLPNNTQFDFEYLLPWSYMKEVHWDRPDWETSYIQTVVLLKPGVSEAAANTRFSNLVKLHAKNVNTELFLHPLSKWRLWSKFENGKIAGGYIHTVRLFGVIAAFILLIACINYMNLSTARSVKRAREVGIRKAIGAAKHSLITQFIGESILVAFVAGLIALLIAQLTLNWFNDLTGKQLHIPYASPYFWLTGLCFLLFTGTVAGTYPAFYLSAYRPVQVLKGTFKAVNALITPRKLLVVLQFTFAIGMIICTIIIYRQIRYGQSRDVGYNQNNLAYIFLKGDMQKKYQIIKQELYSSGAITSVTRTNSPITDIWNGDDSYEWEGKNGSTSMSAALFHTDKDFVKTMGMQLVSGRDIDVEKYSTDSSAVILNETAVKIMGLKNAVNKPLKSREGNWHVVGVVKDFIPGTPFASNFPVIVQGPGKHHWYGTMTIKLNAQNSTAANLTKIGAILKKYNPDYPFDYYFADETYAGKFANEKRTASLVTVFAGLTILISCLGLFALAAYMAENRTKEIGIRKVLGASVTSIATLLSRDFLKLVLIAFLVSSPIAYWAMKTWLNNYEYRINMGVSVFIITGGISIVIAILTVSSQAIKAAIANPAKSLRTQ
jgi:putative ABC transport system permease protein